MEMLNDELLTILKFCNIFDIANLYSVSKRFMVLLNTPSTLSYIQTGKCIVYKNVRDYLKKNIDNVPDIWIMKRLAIRTENIEIFNSANRLVQFMLLSSPELETFYKEYNERLIKDAIKYKKYIFLDELLYNGYNVCSRLRRYMEKHGQQFYKDFLFISKLLADETILQDKTAIDSIIGFIYKQGTIDHGYLYAKHLTLYVISHTIKQLDTLGAPTNSHLLSYL